MSLDEILTAAKLSGATKLTLSDGTVIEFAKQEPAAAQVPEAKASDLVAPLPALDEPTEEEILYYSTDYYDELQARKEAATKPREE